MIFKIGEGEQEINLYIHHKEEKIVNGNANAS